MKLSQRVNKEIVKQDADNVRFARHYDVIVAGLGTAGAIAAIAAGRRGLRVLGVERLNCMGGIGTAGMVQGYYFGSRGGMYEEIDEETNALVKQGAHTPTGGSHGEIKRHVMERHALNAGVAIQYETSIIGVWMDENRIVGLRLFGPDGSIDVGASIVIDATGDAEVTAMAGGAFRIGRASDGLTQPYSNVIKRTKGRSASQFYTDSGYVDPTDGNSVSTAIIDSALRSTHLKERYEVDERLIFLAPLLGIREGRFIEGEYDVLLADILSDKLADEPVFYAYSNLDNHSKDVAFESELYQDWIVAASLWGLNMSVPVPLGAMIPRHLDGVLVAGRSIALDHDMATCVRMKRDMQKCGEVAAAAAALSIRHGVGLRDVPYAELADELRSTGCLDERNHVGYGFPNEMKQHQNLRGWLQDPEAIREGLSSDKPGIAIWSAKRLGNSIVPELKEWLQSEDNNHLRRHSAIALALAGDNAAVPELEQAVRERDDFMPLTSRKYNQVRGYTAIYLLGKLGYAGIVPELTDIMRNRDAFRNLSTDAEFINSDEEYYFQYFTFSMMALFRIGDKHPSLREEIGAAIRDTLDSEGFSLTITLKPSKDQYQDMTATIRRIAAKQLERWQADPVVVK